MKTIKALVASLVFFLFYTAPVYAQINICPNEAKPGANFTALCDLATKPAGQIIRNVIIFLLLVATIIAIFFLIWGGIKWILSGGDKSAVEGARNTVIASVIGLAITFLAFFIISAVGSLFGVNVSDVQFFKIIP